MRQPASPAYGAVSVVVQALADVSIVRSLPPSVFWPRPKVDSAVVALRPDPAKRAAVADVAWFHGSGAPDVFPSPQVSAARAGRNVARPMGPRPTSTSGSKRKARGQLRAEVLDIDEFVALAQGLRERFGAAGLTPPRPGE